MDSNLVICRGYHFRIFIWDFSIYGCTHCVVHKSLKDMKPKKKKKWRIENKKSKQNSWEENRHMCKMQSNHQPFFSKEKNEGKTEILSKR